MCHLFQFANIFLRGIFTSMLLACNSLFFLFPYVVWYQGNIWLYRVCLGWILLLILKYRKFCFRSCLSDWHQQWRHLVLCFSLMRAFLLAIQFHYVLLHVQIFCFLLFNLVKVYSSKNFPLLFFLVKFVGI